MLVNIPDFRLRLVEEAEKVLKVAIDRAVKLQKPLTVPLPELRVAPDSAADGDDFSLPVVSNWGAGHPGHGTNRAGVQRQLAEHYPMDRATGFALGDLRGAFSVRVKLGDSDDV